MCVFLIRKKGTRPVRLICTLCKNPLAINPYRISQFAPALSGLPPDPAPPLCLTQPPEGGLCVWQSWRRSRAVLRGSFATTPQNPAGARRSVRRGLGTAVPDWRHGVGRRRRTVARPQGGSLGGVSNTRPIVLAGCGLLNTRRDTRLGALPPTKRGRTTPARNDCHRAANNDARELSRGESKHINAGRSRYTAVSRARLRAPQGDPLCGRPTAGLDRRCRRARINASAPGGMQPVSHRGEWGRGERGHTSYPHPTSLDPRYNTNHHAGLNAWRQPRVGHRLHPIIGRSVSRESAPFPQAAETHVRQTRGAQAPRVFTGG